MFTFLVDYYKIKTCNKSDWTRSGSEGSSLKALLLCAHFFLGDFMNKKYMDLAFKYAEEAFKLDEVPIGAVIVRNNQVISYGFNTKEKDCCVMSHAEIIAIKRAEEVLGNWRLEDCDLYVTLDPCPMCASAIKQSRIKNVYSALNNSDINNLDLIKKIFSTDSVNSSINFITNCETKYSQDLLKKFFEKQRNK